MPEALDWNIVIWTGLVFLSGYLIGARGKGEIAEPLHFDVNTVSPEARMRIEQSLKHGKKIEAIRTLRADTGLGLKDAKTVIDRWGQTKPPGTNNP